MIPGASPARLFRAASRHADIPNLGLTAAERTDSRSSGIFGRLVRNAPTLGAALETAPFRRIGRVGDGGEPERTLEERVGIRSLRMVAAAGCDVGMDIISKQDCEALLDFIREIAAPGIALPSLDELQTMVACSFWASLETEEGRPVQFAMVFGAGATCGDEDLLASAAAVELSSDGIVKLAPAVLTEHTGLRVQRGPDGGLRIDGLTPLKATRWSSKHSRRASSGSSSGTAREPSCARATLPSLPATMRTICCSSSTPSPSTDSR